MTTLRQALLITISLSLLIGACARRPNIPVVAAPPPTAAPAPPPPAPKEFQPNDAVKPVFFDFDKAVIRPDDAKTLDASAAWLKQNANQLLLIEGHCDERGTNEYNTALGDRRAKSTMNYLVSRGVAASRISLISYGEERPLCSQHDPDCWAKNRRAHFMVKGR